MTPMGVVPVVRNYEQSDRRDCRIPSPTVKTGFSGGENTQARERRKYGDFPWTALSACLAFSPQWPIPPGRADEVAVPRGCTNAFRNSCTRSGVGSELLQLQEKGARGCSASSTESVPYLYRLTHVNSCTRQYGNIVPQHPRPVLRRKHPLSVGSMHLKPRLFWAIVGSSEARKKRNNMLGCRIAGTTDSLRRAEFVAPWLCDRSPMVCRQAENTG